MGGGGWSVWGGEGDSRAPILYWNGRTGSTAKGGGGGGERRLIGLGGL